MVKLIFTKGEEEFVDCAASMCGDSLNNDVYHKDGLRELRDKDDYVRFLDVGFDDDDNQISIYIDDYHEPLLDWIEEEKAKEGDSGTDTYEDDVDSILSDDLSVDHEVDDEDIQWPELVDPFLSHKNLIPERGIAEEVVDKVKKTSYSRS
ncbi:unnamed protein product [Lactuca virosa]|uniref:Uncharacterized protein n=1 Tax=Lactuca virosa TaxID=75947 RepID=A0AAU9N259_9ASTR|nr:unnamed protein product [Lactuca virosa]